jgi:predicted metal-binding membrane protein
MSSEHRTATDRRRRTAGLSETRLVALGVYLVALVAWLSVIGGWLPMPGTGSGGTAASMAMADPGAPEAMATGSGLTGWVLYLVMWTVMMVAMMYPSSVPLVRMYHGTLAGRPKHERLGRVGAFLGGYTLVWAGVGVVPLVVNQFVPLARVAGSGVLLGGTLLLLGVYQLSPYKDRCLSHCRTPLGFLLTHSRPGVGGAARMGIGHGRFCLGCCWALFAFMVVVGTMNVVWMAVITAVLSVERTVSWGDRLARGVGVVAGVGGVVVLAATVGGLL